MSFTRGRKIIAAAAALAFTIVGATPTVAQAQRALRDEGHFRINATIEGTQGDFDVRAYGRSNDKGDKGRMILDTPDGLIVGTSSDVRVDNDGSSGENRCGMRGEGRFLGIGGFNGPARAFEKVTFYLVCFDDGRTADATPSDVSVIVLNDDNQSVFTDRGERPRILAGTLKVEIDKDVITL